MGVCVWVSRLHNEVIIWILRFIVSALFIMCDRCWYRESETLLKKSGNEQVYVFRNSFGMFKTITANS